MDTFLSSYKNEVKEAKKHGQVDEKAADKIPYTLFRLFLGWALDHGNTFVWQLVANTTIMKASA